MAHRDHTTMFFKDVLEQVPNKMLGEFAIIVTAMCWGISPILYALGVETTDQLVANIIRLAITSEK